MLNAEAYIVDGAENVQIQVEIDCDLEDEQLNRFLMEAAFASPLNGLMRMQLDNLFKLTAAISIITVFAALRVLLPLTTY